MRYRRSSVLFAVHAPRNECASNLKQIGIAFQIWADDHGDSYPQAFAGNVIVEPFHDRKIAEKVASSTGAKVVDFAQYPGALPNTDSYVKLIDRLVANLTAALK